ncbi:MAG TPA: DUF3471 domain-containing protein, partial [Candidatus Acidoferrales bacterium]|nr:DUF3471 domain-containing protein [Candidatus Acidoferrales bacterium]
QSIDNVIFDRSTNQLDEFCARERYGRERLDFAEADRKRSTIPNTTPSRPLATYAGSYEDAFYGTATVALRNGNLHLSFIGFEGPLDHWQFDSFTVAIDDPYLRAYKSVAVFDLDDFGEPSELTLVVLGGLRLKLARKHADPPAVGRTVEELRRYEGRFESAVAALRIAIDAIGESLKLTAPGALTGSGEDVVVLDLIPVAEGRFAIASTRSTIAFDGDTAAVLETPHQMPVRLTRRG